MGDFNCFLNREERVRSKVRDAEMEDFKRYVTRTALQDIKSIGYY